MKTISLADGLYQVEALGELDNQVFSIYKDDEHLATLGINEHGEWEANNRIDPELVKNLGTEIESQFEDI